MTTTTIRKFFLGFSIGTWLALCGSLAFAAPKAPEGKPLATCNDGKTEYSTTGDHRGACSGHGGVASWADGSPVRAKAHKTTSYR